MNIKDFLNDDWIDSDIRPKNNEVIIYLFEPFMRCYLGIYDVNSDSVFGDHGFTSWVPEVLYWIPNFEDAEIYIRQLNRMLEGKKVVDNEPNL